MYDEPITKEVFEKAKYSGQITIMEFLVNRAESQGLDLESGDLAIFGDFLRTKGKSNGNFFHNNRYTIQLTKSRVFGILRECEVL